MKKSLIKRIGCAGLAAAMALSLAACGKKKDEVPLASKDNVFTAAELEIPVNLSNINVMRSDGKKIYLYGSVTENKDLENGEYYWSQEDKLVILDMDGNLIKDNTILKRSSEDEQYEEGETQKTVSRYINNAVLDTQGNFWALENEYSYDPVTFESEENYFLVQYSDDGEKLNQIDLSTLQDEGNDDYFYVNNFTIDNDGNVYLVSNNVIYVTDKTGKVLFKIEGESSSGNSNSGSYINGVYRTQSGKVILMENCYSYQGNDYKNWTNLKEVDVANKGVGKIHESTMSINQLNDGTMEHDLILITDTALKGYNLETGETTPIIDWLRSGFDSTTLQNSMVLDDGRILCSTYSYENRGGGYSYGREKMLLSVLTKVDPADVPDKKLIKIASWYLDYNVRQRAVEFNKTSNEYQIEVVSYMEENGYNDALTKLNNDLIAGNIPDILVLNSYNMPVDSYIAKGMFADIYSFIDKDEELNREDYLSNIFDAYSVDGKLYSVIPYFNAQTIVGKTSDVGSGPSWTMDEFLKFVDEHPDKQVFGETTKANFLSSALYYSMDNYVNSKTGVCNFNSDDFVKLLEFSNRFPTEIDYDLLYADQSYYEKQQSQYRDGSTLLSQAYISRFQIIREYEQGTFGAPVTFIGFPNSTGNGSAINADLELAIMAKAKNADGAWEFCRYFLTDEYQDKLEYSFPVKESAYATIMEKAKEKPYYMDGEDKVEYDNTWWNGTESISIGVNTDEDNAKMMDFIKSLSQPMRADQNLTNIITEETESFFSGQKTAKEVADIIQNRATVYINESR